MSHRILHIISGLSTGGAEATLDRIARGSGDSLFEHVVVSLSDVGPVGTQLQHSGIRVEVLGLARGRPTLRGFQRLRDLLRRVHPDLVQTWMYHANLMGLVAAQGMPSVPVVWNIRGSGRRLTDLGLTTWLTVRAGAFLSRRPAAIIANSEAGKRDHIRMGYAARRWRVIYNGVDIDRFRSDPVARERVRRELKASEHDLVVGVVGRYHRVKGSLDAIRAFQEVHRKRQRSILVLVGEGMQDSNPEVNALVLRLGVRQAVRLTGNRSDVPDLMNGLDVLLSPSHSEGFPNVVAEAMATEIPCVVTDVGDSARIVGDAGRVVPPGEVEEMAAALLLLSEMGGSERADLGHRGRQRVASMFTVPAMLKAYERLWDDLLTGAMTG